jgi:hypothetical protein
MALRQARGVTALYERVLDLYPNTTTWIFFNPLGIRIGALKVSLILD